MTSDKTGGPPAPRRFLLPLKSPRSRRGAVTSWLGLIAAAALVVYLINWSPLIEAQNVAGTPGTPGATPTVTPEPDAPRIVVDFTELNDSGIKGTATLSENGDTTIVQMDLTGTGDNHPAHIHEGTCDDLQPEAAYNLQNVGKDGTSTTVVDAPLSDLIDGDFTIDLHLSPNELGLLIGCAGIEGTPEVPGEGGIGGTPTATVTPSVTPIEIATPTEQPSPSPTQEPTTPSTVEATASPADTSDGTGGSDGTSSGTSTGSVTTPDNSGQGGITSGMGDGTQGGSSNISGKGVPLSSATGNLAATGSGSSLIAPTSPSGAMFWASSIFAVILAGAAIAIRRGELRYATAGNRRRWGRLGL